MKIRIVTPITTPGVTSPDEFAAVVGPDVTLEQVSVERGAASLESRFEDSLAAPEVVLCSIVAEREGADAIVVDCLGDPGVAAAREVVSIPVVGPMSASAHLIAGLGHRFTIVTVSDALEASLYSLVRAYGLERELCSIRGIDTPVLDLYDDHGAVAGDLASAAIEAVERDGAHAVLLGCTGMKGLAEAVSFGLADAGHSGIPVVDPMPAAIKLAETLVTLGLSQSRRTYPKPPAKQILGYEALVAAMTTDARA